MATTDPNKIENVNKSKNKSKHYVVKIHFEQKILNTKLVKNTSEWTQDLFLKFSNGIKHYLKIDDEINSISMYVDEKKENVINNSEEFKQFINDQNKNENNDIIHLYISIKPIQKKEDKEDKEDETEEEEESGRQMDKCFRKEMNEIISFYRSTLKQIKHQTQSDFNFDYLSSESLLFGTQCLNMLRPSDESYDVNHIKHKIEYWQKYCHLYLICLVLMKCIGIKSQIVFELFLFNYNDDDDEKWQYLKIKNIVTEYHKLYENDTEIDTKCAQFINELENEINIEILNEMLPKQSDNKTKVKISKQSGNKLVQIKKKTNNLFGANINKQLIKKHRIYFLSPYLGKYYLYFPQINNGEQFEMHFVDETRSKYLMYLDVEICWSTIGDKSLFISFRILTQTGAGFIVIKPKTKLLKRYSGYLWVERVLKTKENKDSNMMQKAWSYFTKLDIGKKEINASHLCIIEHLMSGIEDYTTYYFVEVVLICLKSVRPKANSLDIYWKQELQQMGNKLSLNHCFRLQLIKNIYESEDGSALSIKHLFDIVRSAMIDNKSEGNKEKQVCILKIKNERLSNDIGIGFVYSFLSDVRQQLTINKEKQKKLKTCTFFKLYSIYNFFRYFQILRNQKYGKRYGTSAALQFIFDLDYNWFVNDDKSWSNRKLCDIVQILNVDLNIASMNTSYKRNKPFEIFICGLCASLHNADQSAVGLDLFHQIMDEIVKKKNKKLSQMIFIDMFSSNKCTKYIFNLLSNNMNEWRYLITILDPKFIKTNKIILSAFLFHLKALITHTKSNNCVELQNICDLISSVSMLDTINIRLSFLSNEYLVLCKETDDFNKNIINIMKIVLKGNFMHDSIEKELIKFMSNLFEKDEFRNVALSVFGQLCNYTQPKLFDMFKSAIHKSLSIHPSIPDRFIMYLSCTSFYTFEGHGLHQYFIEKAMEGKDPKMFNWTQEQTQDLQKLLSANKAANILKLFNQILNELIVLPGKNKIDDVVAIEVKKHMHANDNLTIDYEIDFDANHDIDDKEEDEEHFEIDMELKESDESDDVSDDDDDVFLDTIIDNEYYEKLEYCILMVQWAGFSVKNKHLLPLNKFIMFVLEQLKKLDKYLRSKRLNIQCIDLLYAQSDAMKTLIKESMPWFNKKSRIKSLKSMLKQYEEWIRLKAHFITFLTKYTKQDEDEVFNETKDFVNFLKNWDCASYKTVKRRREWKQLLTANNNDQKLQFLNEKQDNGVFLGIWYQQRRDNEAGFAWNDYMKTLYKQAKRTWDDLTLRIKKNRLKYTDRKWFKNLDLVQELNKMQLDQKIVNQIKRDMDHSLQLDEFIPFVISLTKLVQIFLDCNTKLKSEKDSNWTQLLSTLSTAKAKQNYNINNLDIAEAAELFRNMNDAIDAYFDDINRDWIRATCACSTSLLRMSKDEEFKDEFFIETLTLLDDSNDGELTQLSGALRSVQKKFKSIWEQTFKNKSELMRYFASIPLEPNEINNIFQVHDALPRIKRIVEDAGKMAEVRDMQKLDKAMVSDYFQFEDQNAIKQTIDKSDDVNANEIGKKCLSLHDYNCEDVENMIDIILLCRRTHLNYDDDDDDEDEDDDKDVDNASGANVFDTILGINDLHPIEEDKDIANDVAKEDEKYEHEGDVEDYIKKLEICKEISELRVRFVLNGGRVQASNEDANKIKASSDITVFEEKRKALQHKVVQWRNYVKSLRNSSHLFTYFTINEIRMIMDKLNRYQSIELGRSEKTSLFRELVCHFRFAKSEITASELRKHIKNWKVKASVSDESLLQFNEVFNTKIIMNSYQGKDIKNCDEYITYGRPNLLLVLNKKNAIFSTLKLYLKTNNIPIAAYQILICDSKTSSEEIHIFMHRCLQNEVRYDKRGGIPLFCILFPEELNNTVLDETIDEFNEMLLGKIQKTKHYSLIVISCDQSNALSRLLGQYRITNLSKLKETESESIRNLLFSTNKYDIDSREFKQKAPFVEIFSSKTCGSGKTFMIKQKGNLINHRNDASTIRIPFNSPSMDLDFIVNRLYDCYDGIPRAKIIYHIDISSSTSQEINSVLFNILFLRYITNKSKNKCFSISNDMSFLIELPSNLAAISAKKKNLKIEDEFYLFYKPMKYTNNVTVTHDTNPFIFDSNCEYAAKFLQYFYSGELKRDDPDPDPRFNTMPENEIRRIISRHFPKLSSALPIHQKAFWQYLFTQFQQVVASTLIRNEWYKDAGVGLYEQHQGQQFTQWKHLVTESIIDLAEDFSKKLYENNDEKYNDGDESSGKEKFHLCTKWQSKSKPIVLLNQSVDGSISFLVSDIDKMDATLKNALQFQQFDLLGWKQQNKHESKQQKIQLLLKILGTRDELVLYKLLSAKPYCDYALTYDNMLKMIAIYFRIKASIPVILMGETGCGKTSLLNYLASAADIEIERADVHGGFTAKHIRNKMCEWIKKANQKISAADEALSMRLAQSSGFMNDSVERDIIIRQELEQYQMKQTSDLWIFLDEINTSRDIGYFKEILCDNYFDGKPLPPNMKVIAACNPYRKRNIDHLSAQLPQIEDDPLAQYMYRVYPLPSTMKEYVWMFGSLSKSDEEMYTIQMTQTFTQHIKLRDKQIQKISDCIVISQEFVRNSLKDSAFVSLRDIARCLKLFVWKYERNDNHFEDALIESLALVYYFRLSDSDRQKYNEMISQFTNYKFYSTLCKLMDKLCTTFAESIPRGIALNRSLKENLFLLFTCIMTKTPLILVGKPGSSKTLAMAIIRDYFSSTQHVQLLKDNNLFPIHVVSFQCSAQSRAEGIEERWKQTVSLSEDNTDMIYVLLLDEIGLAEHSPYRPLKILHQLLEIDPAPISFVGLSNWPLDAAKMNRAIMHSCPVHKVYDLRKTARAMAQQFTCYTSKTEMDKIETKLSLLSDVYDDVMNYKNLLQPRYDFFGARDFYSVVRHFLSSLTTFNMNMDQNEQLILYFLRNFGGINYGRIDGSFTSKKGTSLNKLICKHLGVLDEMMISKIIEKYSPSALVQLNLNDKRTTNVQHNKNDAVQCDNFLVSRHVMVITEYANSWNVLLDLQIINYHQNIFIFGSQFERDTESNIYLYLNRIKNCMETGKTLILCHLGGGIHESLYDMLNQRYTFRKTDGKMYCRIALGSNSQTCFVDPSFKCIVVTNKKDAHSSVVPIAFLNRFEKQLISYYSSLSDSLNMQLLNKLKQRIYAIYHLTNRAEFKFIFPGFCRDSLPSIVLNVYKKYNDDTYLNDDIFSKKHTSSFHQMSSEDFLQQEEKHNQVILSSKNLNKIIDECCINLLDVTLPEALIQTTISSKKAPIKYIATLQQIIDNHEHNCNNKLLMILTFDFQSKLKINKEDNIIIRRMTQFGKSDEFETFIYRFIKSKSATAKTLLLQYRHKEGGINHLIHIKHTIISLIRKRNASNKNKHKIILMVHLYRSPNLYSEFPLIFSESLKIIFLDSLTQQTPIELATFAHQTIKQVMNLRGIKLLNKTFQRSLSHLTFPQNIDIENQIERLQAIFSADANANNNIHYQIQQVLFKRFLKLLSDDKINRKIAEVVCDSIHLKNDDKKEENEVNRGSLYERLDSIIDRIGCVAMIHVLQPLFENNNISLLDNLYFYELYASLNLIEEIPIKESMEEIVTKKPNSLHIKHEYDAKFPFSSFINEWCSSHKSVVDDVDDEDDDQDEKDTAPQKNVNMNPNIVEYDFLHIDKFKNEKTKQVSSFLQREMENKLPSSLCNLPINSLCLYANDMIWIYRHKLSLNASNLENKTFSDLCAKVLVIITSLFCHYDEVNILSSDNVTELDNDLQIFAQDEFEAEYKNPFREFDEFDDKFKFVIDDDNEVENQIENKIEDNINNEFNLNIAELEATMWTESKIIYHLIRVCSVFKDREFMNICDNIMQSQYGTQSFLNVIDFLFEKILQCLDEAIFKTFNLLNITSSIEYILSFIDLHSLRLHKEEGNKLLIVKSNMIKVKCIAIKNGLNAKNINSNKLLNAIQEDHTTFVNKQKLLNILSLLTELDEDEKDEILNDLLHDVLELIDDKDIVSLAIDNKQMMDFAQFLIDLLSQNIYKSLQLSSATEYVIVCKLFIVLSNESLLSNDSILNQIKNGENSELNGMIIQIMSSTNDNKKQQPKAVRFVRNKSEFNSSLAIHAPLIAHYNANVFNQIMDSISILKFLLFFRNKIKNKSKYPILSVLSAQNNTLFIDGLQYLFDISQWFRLIHSKYQGTLTTTSCTKIKMNDVFGHISLNKWGDENEWKLKYDRFKTGMNKITNDAIDPSNFRVPIASCLMTKNSGVHLMDNNFKIISQIINLQNDFLDAVDPAAEIDTIDIDFFNLLPLHLISIDAILRAIKSNSKPWICYDAQNELLSETFLLFDLHRIEREIANKCIVSRHKLNVKYMTLAFIGNKNMLQLIRCLSNKINQEILSYEIWHSFDKQFESNIHRKEALNIIEDVISLLSYSKAKNNKSKKEKKKHKKKFGIKWFKSNKITKKQEIKDNDDDDDDDKDDEKEEIIIHNNAETISLSIFMKKTLKLTYAKYNLFNINEIKLCHIQSIWSELMKRIEGEMVYYADQCYICFDWIGKITPIELECCGLKLHYECLKDYVESKFMNDGKRITLKQLSCLMCKRQMIHKSATQLFKPIDELYEKVKNLVLNRLKLEDKIEDVPNNMDPVEYAMKLYSCFICFSCRNPYYGGLNDCGGDLEDNINPKERLCSKCGKPQDYETTCTKHGDEYIQWKCRFCCSLATFFCFGTTHFCESCHCKAHHLSQMEKEKLVQCPCKSNLQTHLPETCKLCPLQIKHPPSGEEYCLGCAYCRKDHN